MNGDRFGTRSQFRLARPQRCAGDRLTKPDEMSMALKGGHHTNSDLSTNKKTLPQQGL
jgi:hypothetical protein